MYKEKRDIILFIEHVIISIKKIERYVKDIGFNNFKNNDMIVDAVIRNFKVIEEAITYIPEEIQKK